MSETVDDASRAAAALSYSDSFRPETWESLLRAKHEFGPEKAGYDEIVQSLDATIFHKVDYDHLQTMSWNSQVSRMAIRGRTANNVLLKEKYATNYWWAEWDTMHTYRYNPLITPWVERKIEYRRRMLEYYSQRIGGYIKTLMEMQRGDSLR